MQTQIISLMRFNHNCFPFEASIPAPAPNALGSSHHVPSSFFPSPPPFLSCPKDYIFVKLERGHLSVRSRLCGASGYTRDCGDTVATRGLV